MNDKADTIETAALDDFLADLDDLGQGDYCLGRRLAGRRPYRAADRLAGRLPRRPKARA